VNGASSRKKPLNNQLSLTNSHRQLIQGDDSSIRATPSPTSSIKTPAASTHDDVMPSAAADHEPPRADVIATSLPQQVAMATREPRTSDAWWEHSKRTDLRQGAFWSWPGVRMSSQIKQELFSSYTSTLKFSRRSARFFRRYESNCGKIPRCLTMLNSLKKNSSIQMQMRRITSKIRSVLQTHRHAEKRWLLHNPLVLGGGDYAQRVVNMISDLAHHYILRRRYSGPSHNCLRAIFVFARKTSVMCLGS